MFARWKSQIWLTAIIVVLAVLAGALPRGPVAYAQGEDRDYVDVEVILESPSFQATPVRKLDIIVVNNGSRTAYDVEVVVNVVRPKNSSHFTGVPQVPVGNASLESDGAILRWTMPEFGGLQRAEINTDVRDKSTVAPIFDKSGHAHEFFGEVTTSSFESDLHKSNNAKRIWSNSYSISPFVAVQAKGDYAVSVSVDEQFPAPGDTVNFTVTAIHARDLPSSVIDQKVAIELTDGLAVHEDPPDHEISYDPSTRAASVVYNKSDRVFNIGTRIITSGSTWVPQHSVTLPIRVSSDAVVNEQCLTATITGNPPPGPGPRDDDISDNVAKVCLGEPPVEPLVSGKVDAFTVYPCVGITDAPCDSTNDMRVRAVDASGLVWGKGTALIWVPGDTARIYNGHLNSGVLQSVNDGNTVSWQTAVATGESYGTVVREGVQLYYSRAPFAGHESDWKRPQYGISARDADGNTPPPGKVFFRSTSSGNELRKAESPNYEEVPTTLSISAVTAAEFHRFLEFEKLGTYKITWHAAAKRSTLHGSEDCLPDSNDVNQAFCATETYTFHVGPMADLTVEDGGGSSQVAADRSALTIVATNNGPDHSLGARITGLPMNAEVIHISQGRYDSSAGVWDVGELKHKNFLRSAGDPEGAALVLSAAAGDTADVNIASSKDYEVCVGPKSDPGNLAHTTKEACEAVTNASWNSTPVYDYKPDNNTATITARGGGAAGAAGGPMAPRFANTPVLTWEAVPHVNNWPVYRYQVQYLSGNDWVNLAEVPGDQTHYADTGAGSRRSYRVRALNEAGVPGFWSRSASQVTYRQASPPLNVTAVAGQPGEVVVSWEPSSDDGGSPITHYQAQWSSNGTSGWSNACRSDNASGRSCTNTGIPSGETRYYRVAAYAGGLGAWSDLAVATTKAGVPEAPSLSASRATRGSGDDILRAIRLTWSQPRDNGSTIYAYEIDYVDYDQEARRCGTEWEALDGVGGPYSDSPVAREYLDAGNFGDGLEPGAYRCYRVRAVNSAGAGAWSNAASASAGGAVPPDQWLYLDGEADGQNAITLYWGEPHYDGGAPVTGYQLQYADDTTNSNGELNWRNLTTTSASARSYTHTGRKVGETWHYRVRARNSAGWGGWSYPVTVTIAEGATAGLSQPSLTVQARTSKEVLLSWSSLCNPNREGDCEGKGVDGYMVEYSEDGGLYGWERLTWLWTDQTTVLDATVEPGATRYYRVAGYKEENRRQLLGRWSQIKKATTGDFRVGAPQNFTIEKEGERGLRLVWDEVTEGRDAASITGYRIERSTWNGDGPGDFDTSWVARQTNRGIGPYVETGLTPNTQYYYRVAAVTRNGAVPYIGPYSMASIFIPPAGN